MKMEKLLPHEIFNSLITNEFEVMLMGDELVFASDEWGLRYNGFVHYWRESLGVPKSIEIGMPGCLMCGNAADWELFKSELKRKSAPIIKTVWEFLKEDWAFCSKCLLKQKFNGINKEGMDLIRTFGELE